MDGGLQRVEFGKAEMEHPASEPSGKDIDGLAFGATQLDAAEGATTVRDPEAVIGRGFFTQVAPCTNTPRFEGEFDGCVEPGGLNVMLEHTFDHRMKPTKVRVHMEKAPGGRWLPSLRGPPLRARLTRISLPSGRSGGARRVDRRAAVKVQLRGPALPYDPTDAERVLIRPLFAGHATPTGDLRETASACRNRRRMGRPCRALAEPPSGDQAMRAGPSAWARSNAPDAFAGLGLDGRAPPTTNGVDQRPQRGRQDLDAPCAALLEVAAEVPASVTAPDLALRFAA